MMNRKGLAVVMLLCLIVGFLYWNEKENTSYSTTSSYLYIDIKESSADWKELWIEAHNPFEQNAERIRLRIDDPNVWNLIKKNEEYFVGYSKNGDEDFYRLDQISYPAEQRKDGIAR
jgi:spore coat polysaccharide biosynthesis protein SpsF (cytidylyltransferase family)